MNAKEGQFPERNDRIFNDSWNLGNAGNDGPSIDTLITRHKVLGEERPISGSGLAAGKKAAKR